MALDLAKYGASQNAAPASTGKLDLSRYGAAEPSRVTPAPAEPTFFERIANNIQARGQANVDIYKEYTSRGDTSASNNVAGGLKIAANTFGGIGDLFTELVNTNPITKTAVKIAGDVTSGAFNAATNTLSNTKLFQEAAQNPEATKTLEDFLSAGGSLGEIAGNILAAEGARAGSAKGQQVSKDFYQKLTTQTEESINAAIVRKFEKGVKPSLSGKSSATQMSNYRDDIVTAARTIRGNKDNLSYADEVEGPITGKTPTTLQQLSEAIEQTKKVIYDRYSAMAKAAGSLGARVNLTSIVDELDEIAGDPVVGDLRPELASYAKARADSFRARKFYDTSQAQTAIQNLNTSLNAFYKNPNYDTASRAAVDAMIANRLRVGLDEVIEGVSPEASAARALEGRPGYQELKNEYGSLKTIERDVLRASLRDARKSVKGLVDFSDILSGGQVISGLLNFNAGQIASGLTQKAIAEYIKYLNNPNRAIEQMFKAVEKLP